MMPPRIVLLRPRNADNLGAIARVMKNFSLTDWAVVSPNPKLLEVPGLNRLAVKAGDLLETVRRVETFEEAVSDCSWVVGTTMRLVEGRRRSTPRDLAQEAAQRNDEKWALVFGDERNGLGHEDVRQCHSLSFIPASEDQPSLNLSQAVGIYAYELAMIQRSALGPPERLYADDSSLRVLRSTFEGTLNAAGFLWNDDRHAIDDLMACLIRSRLSKKEAGLWIAAMKVVSKQLSPKAPA